jgi:hypothetical protein
MRESRVWLSAYPFVLSTVIGLLGGIRRDTPNECSGLLFGLAALVLVLCLVILVARPFSVPATHVATLTVHTLLAAQLISAGLYLDAPTAGVALAFSIASCLASIVVFLSSAHALWLGRLEAKIIQSDLLCREDRGMALVVPPHAWRASSSDGSDEGSSVSSEEGGEEAPGATIVNVSESVMAATAAFSELAAERRATAAAVRRLAVVASIRPPFLGSHERHVRLSALLAVACQQAATDRRAEEMALELEGTII